jgi:hypothetical protein
LADRLSHVGTVQERLEATRKDPVVRKHVVVDVYPGWHWEHIIFKAMTDIAAELGVELEIRRHGDLPG